jgi:hypothetical protein
MLLSRSSLMIAHVIAVAIVFASPVRAQQLPTGTVQVTVEEPMGMVSGLMVRSAGQSAQTDARGIARLRLPVGRQVVSIIGIGFKPARVNVDIVADSVVAVKVPMAMAEMTMAEVKISATRIERLAGETPTRVEVLDEM